MKKPLRLIIVAALITVLSSCEDIKTTSEAKISLAYIRENPIALMSYSNVAAEQHMHFTYHVKGRVYTQLVKKGSKDEQEFMKIWEMRYHLKSHNSKQQQHD